MEERQEAASPVVLDAGTDPTYIPGLGALGTDGPEAATAERAERPPQDRDRAGAPPAEDDESPEDDEEEDDEEEVRADGPVFEVSDRRGAIVVDSTGVTFRLDDTEARTPWREIGAVQVDTPRFGRRFAVTVYTKNHRHFEGDVQAPARRVLEEWRTELDAALDVWFEDGGE